MNTNEQMTNALLAKIAELEQRATRAEAELAELRDDQPLIDPMNAMKLLAKERDELLADNAALRAALDKLAATVQQFVDDGYITEPATLVEARVLLASNNFAISASLPDSDDELKQARAVLAGGKEAGK